MIPSRNRHHTWRFVRHHKLHGIGSALNAQTHRGALPSHQRVGVERTLKTERHNRRPVARGKPGSRISRDRVCSRRQALGKHQMQDRARRGDNRGRLSINADTAASAFGKIPADTRGPADERERNAPRDARRLRRSRRRLRNHRFIGRQRVDHTFPPLIEVGNPQRGTRRQILRKFNAQAIRRNGSRLNPRNQPMAVRRRA
jgi:hypothetical protein